MTVNTNAMTRRSLLVSGVVLGINTTPLIYIMLITLFGGGASVMFYVIVLPIYLVLLGVIIQKRVILKTTLKKNIYKAIEYIGFTVTIILLFLMSSFNLQTTTEQIQNVSVFTIASIIVWWTILIIAKVIKS
ncbi:hypothetical protein I6F65_06530 [Pseudoalteromonas sp. SWXJZ94C]|uniref:hypothetical protein n=1 Tax=Pseudoalteromonas sp. SWXJZ94C TaxID=2792065 RepID=UPI0018CECF96|nr:hypothetical protein [Pseudoalteromonas sp. SWXJZ94C]MBH0056611.1 hypothetical protein [Pseudoalteromonas sp. SWXJZ94C]